MSWIHKIFRKGNISLHKTGNNNKRSPAEKNKNIIDIRTALFIADETIRKYYGGAFSKIALPQLISPQAHIGCGIPLDMLPKGKKLWGAVAGYLGINKLVLDDELRPEITLFNESEVDSILNETDLFALFNLKLIDLRKIQSSLGFDIKSLSLSLNDPLVIPVSTIQIRKTLFNQAIIDTDARQVIIRPNIRIIKLQTSLVCKQDEAGVPHPIENNL